MNVYEFFPFWLLYLQCWIMKILDLGTQMEEEDTFGGLSLAFTRVYLSDFQAQAKSSIIFFILINLRDCPIWLNIYCGGQKQPKEKDLKENFYGKY